MGFIEQQTGFGLTFNTFPISLKDRFIIPPFSVLDSRQGYWQERKRIWLSLGIKGEIGRKKNLTFQNAAASFDYYRVKEKKKKKSDVQGTSVFDPVLCELTYRWFNVLNGEILDPFAGGSVRGIVAAVLNNNYIGIELRQEQVNANFTQLTAIEKKGFIKNKPMPKWICGDSIHVRTLTPKCYDLIFTCPPYGDLEKYSDDPADLSNMTWEGFLDVYYKIIKDSCSMLKEDRFAVIVVSDFRDEKGIYREFPSFTIEAFKEAGLLLYNDGILLTVVGSLPMRINKSFTSSRKLGKTHQNYLVFYKGDPKNIRNNFSEEI